MKTYISTSDTAKLIRKDLKANFPSTKFSVRSSSYSGGSSISVSWVDGETATVVNEIVKRYEGASFDGSTDSKSYLSALVFVEGEEMPVEVSYGADYVFTHRSISAQFEAVLIAQFESITGEKYEANRTYSSQPFPFNEIPSLYGCQLMHRLSIEQAVKVGA